jgi:hypothetical protein
MLQRLRDVCIGVVGALYDIGMFIVSMSLLDWMTLIPIGIILLLTKGLWGK